jgi:acyl carrier protein
MARIERVETEEIVEGPEAIEAAVVGIFETLLQQGHLRPTDNFFELGGDSVLAVTLVVEIERRLGVVLARSTLLDAPTPRQLVKAVLDARDNVEPDVLVPIHPEGSGPVIFCVHSMRGEVTFPRKLAHAMGGHRPFYGMRVVGLRSGEIMLPTAEEMASQYETEINALQPNGPYLFIGQCGTSVIASPSLDGKCSASCSSTPASETLHPGCRVPARSPPLTSRGPGSARKACMMR